MSAATASTSTTPATTPTTHRPIPKPKVKSRVHEVEVDASYDDEVPDRHLQRRMRLPTSDYNRRSVLRKHGIGIPSSLNIFRSESNTHPRTIETKLSQLFLALFTVGRRILPGRRIRPGDHPQERCSPSGMQDQRSAAADEVNCSSAQPLRHQRLPAPSSLPYLKIADQGSLA